MEIVGIIFGVFIILIASILFFSGYKGHEIDEGDPDLD